MHPEVACEPDLNVLPTKLRLLGGRLGLGGGFPFSRFRLGFPRTQGVSLRNLQKSLLHNQQSLNCLLETLAEFHGGGWDEALSDQWREAIDKATKTMLKGYERAYIY